MARRLKGKVTVSDGGVEELDQAERDTKLTLLRRIKELAQSPMSASSLKDLAAAYALTVGAKFGQLPSGGVDVKVSK
ncbi:hypothetical protein [Mycobacteroides abscessus]|uniref:hypothetical protein n=1 Tax=Mycobacteroides abscessus TaxID=36809 RepID=UPI0018968DB0